MSYSIRQDALHATSVVLAASAATFATAVAMTMPVPAFAGSQDYRFELVQVAPAGPGTCDVTIRLVRATDGKLATDADISANTAVAIPLAQQGYRKFRVETAMPGPQALPVSAKVPGATRVERTFNSSVKVWQERTVHSTAQVVSGVVAFDGR